MSRAAGTKWGSIPRPELPNTSRAALLKGEGKDKAFKSSQAFFSKLQEQVKMQSYDTKKTGRKKKTLHCIVLLCNKMSENLKKTRKRKKKT